MRGPNPYEDEVIGSVLARACLWFGLPPTRVLELYIGRRCGASYCLPVRLELLAETLRVSCDVLRRSHTMHPYAMAFVSIDRKESAPYSYMRYASHSSMFRACPSCIEQDLKKHGESYWHRAHMLPGVSKCLEHGVDLVVPIDPGPDTCTSALQRATPHMCSFIQNCSPQMPEPFQTTWNQISVATLSVGWTRRTSWNEIYESRAVDRGYGRKDGKIAALLLAKDLTEVLGSDFLRFAGLRSASARACLWPATLLKPPCPSVPLSTPKHIALATFLTNVRNELRCAHYAKPGKHPSPYWELDARAYSVLQLRWEELRKQGQRSSVEDLLRGTEIGSLFRHHRTQFPAVDQLVQRFRASNQSIRQVGRRIYNATHSHG